ncbi:MAG: hypothetical protein WCR97_00370 [Bacilli bacterium]
MKEIKENNQSSKKNEDIKGKIEYPKKGLIITIVIFVLLIIVFVVVMVLTNSSSGSSSGDNCDGGTCKLIRYLSSFSGIL